jgi:two-component sensor histidine kinase
VIAWHETDGPPIKAPSHSSYGTKLDLIPGELGVAVDRVFAQEGPSCDLEIPLNEARIPD